MTDNKKPLIRKFALLIIIMITAIGAVLYLNLTRRDRVADYIETTGVVEATEVKLAPRAPGTIEFLCCKEGDAVKKGEAAVRIEARVLKARIEEARSLVRVAEESVKEAEIGLENAGVEEESARFEKEAARSDALRVKALRDEAKENLERAKGLFKNGYISKRDLDAARATYGSREAEFGASVSRGKKAEAAVRAAHVNIKRAETGIEAARARKAREEASLKALLSEIEDTEAVSPIGGVIVEKAYETGEVYTPGTHVYTVFDLTQIWARLDIEETGIGKIRLGDRAAVSTPSIPGKDFEARVTEIGEEGSFATQKDVTRGRHDIKTFRVKAALSNPDGRLKPGMTVTVRIHPSK